MIRILVPLAIFAIAMIELLVHRIQRDAGGRVDSRYFNLSAHVTALRLALLVIATVGDINLRSRQMMLLGMTLGLASAYFMALFAYSFPLNRPAPRSLRWGLGALTLVGGAITAPWLGTRILGPILALAVMIPYFGLTVYFIQRNWRASILPGNQRPAASVTIVQASVVAPWLMIMALMSVMHRHIHAGMPAWMYLAQALMMSVLVIGGIGVAVLRYHLFEVRVLMAEVVMSVLAAGTVASYLGLGAAPLHAWLAQRTTYALASLAVAMVPPMIIRWIVEVLDKHVNRVACAVTRRVPDRGAVERVLTATARLIDPLAVLTMVSTKIAEITNGETVFLRVGQIPREHSNEAPPELVELVREHPRSFYSEEQRPELDPRLAAQMDAMGAQLLLPVHREERLYGVLLVRSAPRISRDGALLSAALADHLALKIDNFALYATATLAARQLADARAFQDNLARELEESRRLASLGAFAAAIAHDIRTPLTSISMNVQILRSHEGIQPGDREYLDIAIEEIDRLNKSVGEILEYAKPLSLAVITSSPSELTEDVARTLEPLWAERGLTLKVECDREASEVSVDERRMRQVLLNLLDNAAEASTRGGTVVLSARATPATVQFEVKDGGRGIAVENLERVFEPFFTTRADGTGLGLAIAQKVVRAHGGDIRVTSEVGRGTTFVIDLPRLVLPS